MGKYILPICLLPLKSCTIVQIPGFWTGNKWEFQGSLAGNMYACFKETPDMNHNAFLNFQTDWVLLDLMDIAPDISCIITGAICFAKPGELSFAQTVDIFWINRIFFFIPLVD